MNDRLCLPRAGAPEAERVRKARKNDVKFFQTLTQANGSGFKSYMISVVNGLGNIEKREAIGTAEAAIRLHEEKKNRFKKGHHAIC